MEVRPLFPEKRHGLFEGWPSRLIAGVQPTTLGFLDRQENDDPEQQAGDTQN